MKKEILIQKMIKTVQEFENPVAQDMFYTTKLIKSIQSGFSHFTAFNPKCEKWEKITLEDIATDGPVGFYYICLAFYDGSHLPLPLLYNSESDYPLQNEIIKIYRETDEAQEILSVVRQAYTTGERLLKERLKEMFPIGEHTVYLAGEIEWFEDSWSYFDRNIDDVIYRVDAIISESEVAIKLYVDEEAVENSQLNLLGEEIKTTKFYTDLNDVVFPVEKHEQYVPFDEDFEFIFFHQGGTYR